MGALSDIAGGQGGLYDRAEDTSADGSVVVGTGSSNTQVAFRWTVSGGMVGLGSLGGITFQSQAHGVSADGSIIVGASESGLGWEAFHWTSGGGMVGLGDLADGIYGSRARDISADGTVIVGTGNSTLGEEAFVWTSDGGMIGLGDLPGGSFHSSAFGVSVDGSVVVGRGKSASDTEAFIWDSEDGMRSLKDVLVNDYGLDLNGWTLQSAEAISDDGLTIVGSGNNPSGDLEAWVANIPEPSCLSLLLFGGIMSVLRAKRLGHKGAPRSSIPGR